MNYKQLQEDVEKHVGDYFHTHSDPRLVYHNLEHTEKVVNAAQQIANHYQLNEQDFFTVTVAAWFHDTGYFEDALNHEAKGAVLADDFLAKHKVNREIRDQVKSAILATKIPQKPKSEIDKILCDADLFHLGLADFRAKGKLMHKENELIYKKEISKSDWRKKDIQFMESHHYHTDYANLLLSDQKQKNIEKLKSKLTAQEVINTELEEPKSFAPVIVKDKKKKDKDDRPDKGIETMFRITSANNQRLSDMADNKAHILITVNSIMLSLIVSLLLRRLEDHGNLIIPTFILLLVSLTCVVVSILSTRPSIPKGEFTQEDMDKKKVNLLFFGNFYKMSLPSYTDGMIKVMNDKDFLYGTLITDVYSQGVVLGRKYKLIRLAYNIFMFGLIAAVFAFVIAYAAYGKL
ncbi:Pycsar system effector family protein [Pedobacter alluvionis]|uniref:HD domain-containing protein n=1 Tax=Pedobacter alluvionis TaxID=475253 RepID=A0A497Y3G8_9SPHI|nr:Pycsar system effector family protein [Pedobacter alluvionis]RLJ74668.1 HD domain-containing protein [Pedobacter alluvionis]TFB29813.1 HD domain-containing protein [Pedobacter alluvionis]